MSDLVIKQYKFYNLPDCRDAIKSIEDRYEYVDETDSFGKLVNFSTAKGEPYQRWVRYREGYSTSLVNNLIERAHISITSIQRCIILQIPWWALEAR